MDAKDDVDEEEGVKDDEDGVYDGLSGLHLTRIFIDSRTEDILLKSASIV